MRDWGFSRASFDLMKCRFPRFFLVTAQVAWHRMMVRACAAWLAFLAQTACEPVLFWVSVPGQRLFRAAFPVLLVVRTPPEAAAARWVASCPGQRRVVPALPSVLSRRSPKVRLAFPRQVRQPSFRVDPPLFRTWPDSLFFTAIR